MTHVLRTWSTALKKCTLSVLSSLAEDRLQSWSVLWSSGTLRILVTLKSLGTCLNLVITRKRKAPMCVTPGMSVVSASTSDQFFRRKILNVGSVSLSRTIKRTCRVTVVLHTNQSNSSSSSSSSSCRSYCS